MYSGTTDGGTDGDVSGETSARLFVALDPPDEVRAALLQWGREALRFAGAREVPGRSARLLDPDHVHLTLCFLGARPIDEIALVAEAVGEVAAPVGSLSSGRRCGCPRVDHARSRSRSTRIRQTKGGAGEIERRHARAAPGPRPGRHRRRDRLGARATALPPSPHRRPSLRRRRAAPARVAPDAGVALPGPDAHALPVAPAAERSAIPRRSRAGTCSPPSPTLRPRMRHRRGGAHAIPSGSRTTLWSPRPRSRVAPGGRDARRHPRVHRLLRSPEMPVSEQEKAAKARDAALKGALSQIEREFGKGTVMRMGDPAPRSGQRDPHGRALARSRPRHRWRASRAHHRDLRPGVLRQDDARLPHHRRGPEARRRLRVHRRRARDGPALRPRDRRRHRRAARLPARLRRAGARGRRHARALGSDRRRRDRLGRRADPRGRSSRARWATRASVSRRA